MATKHLNLTFDGSFAFVYTRECVEVLVPNLGESAKPSIDAGGGPKGLDLGNSYCLSGVNRPTRESAIPADKISVLCDFRVINRGSNALFCSLFLPFPEEFHTSAEVQNGKPGLFDGASANEIAAKSIGLIQKLTYKYAEGVKVRLGTVSLGISDIHVCSGGVSPIRDFDKLVELFPGMELELNQDHGFPRLCSCASTRRVSLVVDNR